MKASESDVLLTAYAGKLINDWQQYMVKFLKPNSDLKIHKDKFREEMTAFFNRKMDKLDQYQMNNGGKKMTPALRKLILDRITEMTKKLNAPVRSK